MNSTIFSRLPHHIPKPTTSGPLPKWKTITFLNARNKIFIRPTATAAAVISTEQPIITTTPTLKNNLIPQQEQQQPSLQQHILTLSIPEAHHDPILSSSTTTTTPVLPSPYHQTSPTHNQQHQHQQMNTNQLDKPNFRPLTLTTPELSFSKTSTLTLLKKYIVLASCNDSLVRYSPEILSLMRKILGKTITNMIIRKTFFEVFCAGETEEQARATMKRLMVDYGVSGILDFAAEQDVGESSHERSIALSRQYAYYGESECDKRVNEFETAIRAAGNGGFAAVKMTALGDPDLMKRISLCTYETRRIFKRISGGLDSITREQFKRGYDALFVQGDGNYLFDSIRDTDNLRRKWDLTKTNEVDLISWTTSMDPRQIIDLAKKAKPGIFSPSVLEIESYDLDRIDNAVTRINALAWKAKECGARLMIDAEQTYFQPVIESITLNLQRSFNDAGYTGAVVFSTYQAYRKDTLSRLEYDILRSRREGWRFACKLVRGAYMLSENDLANKFGYESPIHATIQDTANCYHKSIEMLLQAAPEVEVVVASHNTESVATIVNMLEKMEDQQWISHNVSFAQLYGMADNLSFSLARAGYTTYKYLPFGAVDEVVPYLIRRAQENSSASKNAVLERKSIAKELGRRLMGGK
jgi:proline dehydrogenase